MRLFDEEPEVIEETPLPEVPQEEVLPGKNYFYFLKLMIAWNFYYCGKSSFSLFCIERK